MSAGSPPLADTSAKETAFFVLMLLFGLHTGISVVYHSAMIAPYFLSFLGAVGILTVNPQRVGDRTIDAFIIVSGLILVFGLVAGRNDGLYAQHLKSSAVFLYSVGIGVGSYVGLVSLGARRIEEIFFWVALLLILGAGLEVYGPIKPVSDWFRHTVGAWHSVYESGQRDVMVYGAVRPEFFASEPSILGIVTSLSLFLWMTAHRKFTAGSVLAMAAMILAAAFLIRSPTIVFAPIATVLIIVVMRRTRHSLARALKGLLLTGYIGVVVAVPVISMFLVYKTHSAPPYIKSTSFLERQIAPFLMAADVLRTHPIIGLGTGNEEAMSQEAQKVILESGLILYQPQLADRDIGALIGNAFWQFWIAFGFVGGAAALWALSLITKSFRTPVPVLAVFVIVGGTYWQGIGGPNTSLDWFCFFSIAAMCKVRGQMLETAVAE